MQSELECNSDQIDSPSEAPLSATPEPHCPVTSGGAAAIGISGAIAFLETVDAEKFEQQRRRFDCLAIAEDDASWSWIDGTPGGDALEFLAVFGSFTRSEWASKIDEILNELTPGERESFKPQVRQTREDVNGLFPLDALPPVLGRLSQELAEIHGVPPQFPAAVAIAVIGASVGRGIKLKTWRGMSTYPNLYVLIGMLSGSGKSTVMKPIFAPMFAYERKLRAEHATRLAAIEAELGMIQKSIKKIQNGTTNDER